MAMILVYNKIPEAELRKTAKEAITGIEGFFKKNPKRRVCHAQLWYERQYTIKRAHVAEQINAILEKTLKGIKP